jgi:hypothetical protein
MDSPVEVAAGLRKAGKLWFLGGRKPGVNPSQGRWVGLEGIQFRVIKDG